jgi:hypothetical protein
VVSYGTGNELKNSSVGWNCEQHNDDDDDRHLERESNNNHGEWRQWDLFALLRLHIITYISD